MTPDRTKAPATRPFDRLSIPPETIEVLDNGVTVHTVADTTLPATRITTFWHYGSSLSRLAGLGASAARFATQMLREGTPSRTGSEIADTVEFNGAMLTPHTSDNYSSLDITGLAESVGPLLELLADAFTASTFPTEAFEALRRRAVTQREVDLSKVGVRAGDELFRLMAGYTHPYLGPETPAEIEGCTLQAVKQAWAEGTRDTAIHVYVGGYIDAPMRRLVDAYCHAIRPGRPGTPLILDTVPFSPEPPQRVSLPHSGALQTAVFMGQLTIGRDHPDYIRLRCAVVALGGYFGSRLMTNVREEKGLTYSISSTLNGIKEGAFMSVRAHCSNDKAAQVIDEIGRETERLRTEPMGADELTRLKRFLVSTLATILDSPFSIIGHYQNQLLVGTPENYFEEQFRQINALTADDIRDVAARHLDCRDFSTVTCGPE